MASLPTRREPDAADGAQTDSRSALLLANRLTEDLKRPAPLLYWSDMIASAAIGYAALGVAAAALPLPARLIGGGLAVLALYRALMFIHELTHLKPGALPGFAFAWNLLVGIPLLLPSFLYEGVHTLHHARSRYGTIEDPEYAPLAHRRPAHLLVFLLISLAAPLALLLRATIVAPLAAVSPPLRRLMIARWSSITINPAFRRVLPPAADRRRWLVLEIATSLYAWCLVSAVLTGLVSTRLLVAGLLVGAGIALINQFRTLVAHRWAGDGQRTDALGQLHDTLNVPPPAMLPGIWAPVGLRYHGLHHFLPALPYHSLGEAHRRLLAEASAGWYGPANCAGAPTAIRMLLQSQRSAKFQ